MDINTFLLLVKEMRTQQKTYFANRSPYSLKESKRLEKIIDTEIASGEMSKLIEKADELPFT
jgi:hypothetical protein